MKRKAHIDSLQRETDLRSQMLLKLGARLGLSLELIFQYRDLFLRETWTTRRVELLRLFHGRDELAWRMTGRSDRRTSDPLVHGVIAFPAKHLERGGRML